MCILRIGTNVNKAGPISLGKICLYCSYQSGQASSKMFTSGYGFKKFSPEDTFTSVHVYLGILYVVLPQGFSSITVPNNYTIVVQETNNNDKNGFFKCLAIFPILTLN